MWDEVPLISFYIPDPPIQQNSDINTPEDELTGDKKKNKSKSQTSKERDVLAYGMPGQNPAPLSSQITSTVQPQGKSVEPENKLERSIGKLEEELKVNKERLGTDTPSINLDPNLVTQMSRMAPVQLVRLMPGPKEVEQDQNQKLALENQSKRLELVLTEAQRLRSAGRIAEAQNLIDNPRDRNSFIRIRDFQDGIIRSLNTNTGEITQAQNYLDQLANNREQEAPLSKALTEDSYKQTKEKGEYYIAVKLAERQHHTRVMMEANELVEAGKYSEAEALLSGSLSLDKLGQQKLYESNPNASRQVNPDGTDKTDEEVIKDTRTVLQETINANRAGLAQLEKQISLASDLIDSKAPKISDLLGLAPSSQSTKLTSEQKLTLMEQRNLLSIQKDRLRDETERLFTAHDRITQAANQGNLEQARDMAEGRSPVLSANDKPQQNQDKLADREFVRTSDEEVIFKAQLDELKDTRQQLGILIRGDAEGKEGGLEFKITDTQKDINNSGAFSSIGGRTDALRKTLGAEKQNKTELEQLEKILGDVQIKAKELFAHGRDDAAKSLLESCRQAVSKGFQASNNKLQHAYQGVNKQLESFDRNLKDFAVQGIKVVAISAVASALAPATGGGSLAALTALGTGTLAGIGVGVAIDSVDAAINVGAFNESLPEATARIVSKENIYNNAKTAFSGALASASGAQIFTKLEKFGRVAAAAGGSGGASGLVSTINLTEQRIQAELAYQDALKTNPNLDKEKFMEERGVSPVQLAKAFMVNTTVGTLSGLVGLRGGVIKDAAKTALAKGATEVGEEAASAVIGLAGAYVNDGELTAESIRDELMSATVGNRVGRYANERIKNQKIDINEPRLLDVDHHTKPITQKTFDTSATEYQHPVVDKDNIKILAPENGLPNIRKEVDNNKKLYDTGISLKVGDKIVPITIPEHVALETGFNKVNQSEVGPEQINKLAEGWKKLQDGISIINGEYNQARETGSGLRHIKETHAQPITDVKHLIDSDAGVVKPASQFPYSLNEAQVLELVQGSMHNIESATVARDGALMVTANIPQDFSNLAPGIKQVQVILNPNDGIITFIPLNGDGVVKATLVHADDIPEGGFKEGQNIHKFIARGDQLNDISKLVVVQVDISSKPKFVRMGGSPQVPQR